MTDVAICYFGLTRSTKKIFQTHHDNIFNVLKSNNYNYDVFMHTWTTNDNLVNDKLPGVPIDYEEYKLLNPTYYEIDDQYEFLNSIDFSQYFYNNGDYEWNPSLIRNHLCALESQKRVTNMVLNTGKKYKSILYVRPDVRIDTEFNIQFLDLKPREIAIPNREHFEGYNDRFAIVNYEDCSKYGKRIDEIVEFRKHNGRIVSEKYTKFIVDKYFDNVKFIDFIFYIIRP